MIGSQRPEAAGRTRTPKAVKMQVTTESGLRLSIPSNHMVFYPAGHYRSGDAINPETVPVSGDRATSLHSGAAFIVDNVVEVVASVTAAA